MEGGDSALVAAVHEGRWEDAALTPRLRALCTVAHKMSAEPTRMVEDDWQPLRALGFDDTALLEPGHIVGLFNYLTRLADGFGLQLDPQTAEAQRSGATLTEVAGVMD